MSLEQAIESLKDAVAENATQTAGLTGAIRTLIEQQRGTYGAPPSTPTQAPPPSTPAPVYPKPAAVKLGKPVKPAVTPTPAPTPKPTAEIATTDDVDFLNDEPLPAKPLTKEDARAALVGLQQRSGSPDKSRTVLKQFGADSLGTLKVEQYAAVVAAANAA